MTLDLLFRVPAVVGLEDGLGLDDVFWFAAGATTVIVFIGVVLRPLYRKISGFLHWLGKFRRDWEGEEAEPGRAGVPGIMERMNRVDGELQRNGGSSVKDVVNQTRHAVEGLVRWAEAMDDRVADLAQRQETMETRQKDIAQYVDERRRIDAGSPLPSEG